MDRSKALIATCSVALVAAIENTTHADELINSTHVVNAQFGGFEPFKGFDYYYGARLYSELPPFPDTVTWLFELTGLDTSFEGQSWTADESHPNFAEYEAILTNGANDHIFDGNNAYLPNGNDDISTSFVIEHNFFGFPAPQDPSNPVDLAGYDLTLVTFTFEDITYGESPVFPGVYGYSVSYRIDHYGYAIPAPGALCLLGIAGLTSRRRRRV